MPENLRCSPFAFYAFYQLYAHFHDIPKLTFDAIQRQLFPNYTVGPSKLQEKTSLFITWKEKSSKAAKEYQLRGCIGTFAKLPLLIGIEKYALIAALQDHRFPPITSGEIERLKCSCNILHNFKTIYSGSSGDGDIFNWEIGVHGIELSFKHPQNSQVMSATFLPEVMSEQGWDKNETFASLIEKAGCWQLVDLIMENFEEYFIEVIRYEGDKSEINFEEFISLLPADDNSLEK